MKLPKNEQEFKQMKEPKYTHCEQCTAVFSNLNTHSPLGWRETQLSGLCEDCFDSNFPDEDTDSFIDSVGGV